MGETVGSNWTIQCKNSSGVVTKTYTLTFQGLNVPPGCLEQLLDELADLAANRCNGVSITWSQV